MFCENCGKVILYGQKYCTNCGCEIKNYLQAESEIKESEIKEDNIKEDKNNEELICIAVNGEPAKDEEKNIFSWGLFFLSFFFWQVGLTLYIVYKKSLPVRAESCIRGMLLGIIFYLALIFLGVVALMNLITEMMSFFGRIGL